MQIIFGSDSNPNAIISAIVEKYAENTCITRGETGEKLSYRQIHELSGRVAGYLKKLGLRKGSAFSFLSRNCPEFFIFYIASMKLGTLMVPTIVDLPAISLADLFRRFNIKAVFYAEDQADKIKELMTHYPQIQAFFLGTIIKNVSDCTEPVEDYEKVTADDPISIYFSSGTTGEPKGIAHSIKNLLSDAASLTDSYRFSSSDTQVGILPCYHTALNAYGFWPSFVLGSNFVVFDKFHRKDFWKNLSDYHASFVEVVPTILAMLMNPAEDLKKYNLTALKFIGSGSAPLALNLKRKFEEIFKVRVVVHYGLSEASVTHHNSSHVHSNTQVSIGKPISICETRIMDNGKVVPNGTLGEIVMRGPNIVSGYYKNPEETSNVFIDNWFYTGDLGFRDNHGFYYITGRKKEMISRGGEKIFPNEVDNVLLGIPGIKEVATIGIPSELYGEEIAAYVVASGSVDESRIIEHCKSRLPLFKCPKEILFIEVIPKTPSGKILRRLLVEKYKKALKT